MVEEMVSKDKSSPRRRRKIFLYMSGHEAEIGERTLAGQGIDRV